VKTAINEYLIQHSLKSGGIKDHSRWVKVPGTTLTERSEYMSMEKNNIDNMEKKPIRYRYKGYCK
jgi:hypothetical protein